MVTGPHKHSPRPRTDSTVHVTASDDRISGPHMSNSHRKRQQNLAHVVADGDVPFGKKRLRMEYKLLWESFDLFIHDFDL